MAEFIKPFNQINMSDVALAGGKGASLGEMTQAGIPVPHGFVVLSDAFEHFIEKKELKDKIDKILSKIDHKETEQIDRASKEIQSLILKQEIPKQIQDEIQMEFKKLGAEFVAVRSSATSEDGASAAWAGQLETYLNTTNKTLTENVRKCWASLFTPRAIFYRFEKGFHKIKVSVAVVVQEMVHSEVSGISFSVHPVTKNQNHIIIEAGYGLGEAIVSGQITPDSYIFNKKENMIHDINVVEQKKALIKQKGGGNIWINIDSEKGSKQKLTGQEITQLSNIIQKIENHYGFPVDVEWAKANGKLHITQSRPITTL